MTPQMIAVDVLLGLGTVVACLSVVGMMVMRDPSQRLHYLAPASSITPVLYTIAIVLESGRHQAAVKAILICVVLLSMNAVLTHATARAIRVKEQGRWTTPRVDASADEGPQEEKAA